MAPPEIIKFKFNPNPNPDPVSINDFLKEGNHTNNLRKSEDLKQEETFQNFIISHQLPTPPPEQDMWTWHKERLRIVRPTGGGRRKSRKRKSCKRKSHKRKSCKRKSHKRKSHKRNL